MRHIKKSLTLLLLVLFALSAAPRGEETAEGLLEAEITVREDFTVAVDGVALKSDVPPVEKDGVIFIPLRFAAQALRAEVEWLPEDKKAVFAKGGLKTVMKIGSDLVETPRGEKYLVSAPFIFEKRTMIPLRAAAESLMFRVEENRRAMYLTSPDEGAMKPFVENGPDEAALGGKEGVDYGKVYAIFRAQAKRDAVTRAIRPYVLGAWIAAVVLWLIRLVTTVTRKEDIRAVLLIGFFLFGGVPFVLKVMLSTWWAAIVAVGTSVAGLFSTEDYGDRLVTMGSTAMGLGLICTLFGLGLVIGPAIATHNIAAIGYGIYVKIEPTITGLSLSIIMNILYGYEARKAEPRAASGE